MHRSLATAWLRREQKHGWASCPITQIGCVRVMSQPTADWQVIDTYLLALAVKNRGRLVSFDRRIAPGAVAGAKAEQLVVIQ